MKWNKIYWFFIGSDGIYGGLEWWCFVYVVDFYCEWFIDCGCFVVDRGCDKVICFWEVFVVNLGVVCIDVSYWINK